MPLLFVLATLMSPPIDAGKRNARPTNIALADAAVRKVPQPEEFQLGPGDRIAIRVC